MTDYDSSLIHSYKDISMSAIPTDAIRVCLDKIRNPCAFCFGRFVNKRLFILDLKGTVCRNRNIWRYLVVRLLLNGFTAAQPSCR